MSYQDLFINPESVFVALALIVFIVTMTVLNNSNIFPKGVRVLVSIIIGVFSGYYLFRNEYSLVSEGQSVFLLMAFIFSTLLFQFIFSRTEMTGGKAFFLSLLASGVITFILSRFEFMFSWFEALQSVYIVFIVLFALGIILLFPRKYY